MSKARSRLADYAVYLAVRLLVCLIQALSLEAGGTLAAGVAWLVYHLDRRHRLVAGDNLRRAFPDQGGEAEFDHRVRSIYRHFCTAVVEMIHLPRKFHRNTADRYLDLTGAWPLFHHLRSGRPLIVVAGHFGNWEMVSYGLALLGFPSQVVVRPLDNPFVDAYLRRFRESTGQKLLAKTGNLERFEAVLEAGEVLSIVADQDAGSHGLFVDFFGWPASTHKVVALLALKHSVPLMVIGARKVGEPMRYRLVLQDLICPEDYARTPDPVRAITQRFTTALERMIRTAPEQYFWFHRRWKNQPAKSRRAA